MRFGSEIVERFGSERSDADARLERERFRREPDSPVCSPANDSLNRVTLLFWWFVQEERERRELEEQMEEEAPKLSERTQHIEAATVQGPPMSPRHRGFLRKKSF